MKSIRKATLEDLARIVEIIIFNYRLNFYPIFKNDDYYFNELQVPKLMKQYESVACDMWVYDDGAIKGVIQIENEEIKRLFVEPALQGKSIGGTLLKYAIDNYNVNTLWALEKNARAICFYERYGFKITEEKRLEEDTTEYLVRLKREPKYIITQK